MVQYDWRHKRRYRERKRDTEMHEERMLWMIEAKIEVLQL